MRSRESTRVRSKALRLILFFICNQPSKSSGNCRVKSRRHGYFTMRTFELIKDSDIHFFLQDSREWVMLCWSSTFAKPPPRTLSNLYQYPTILFHYPSTSLTLLVSSSSRSSVSDFWFSYQLSVLNSSSRALTSTFIRLSSLRFPLIKCIWSHSIFVIISLRFSFVDPIYLRNLNIVLVHPAVESFDLVLQFRFSLSMPFPSSTRRNPKAKEFSE